MSNQKAEVKRKFTNLFNNIAAEFDEEEPRYFTYFGERLVELSGIGEGDSVLDVATGKGACLFPASIKAGERGNVVGIDISREMIRMTALKIQRRGIDNTKVIVMDAENLDMEEEKFEFVLCGFSIFFLPDYKTALREFKRVLKENGKCCITTFLREEDEESALVKELIQKYLGPKNGKEEIAGPLQLPEFDTQTGLFNILDEAGFREIKIFDEVKEFIFKDEEEWWRKQWAQATRITLEKLTPEKLEQFKLEAFQKLKEKKVEGGIHFKIHVLYALGSK